LLSCFFNCNRISFSLSSPGWYFSSPHSKTDEHYRAHNCGKYDVIVSGNFGIHFRHVDLTLPLLILFQCLQFYLAAAELLILAR
jgi:hypothetical protein